ncbi:MAG: FIST C-terminal domain-containing protein [Phycisphaerales bacterium]|nr:FIST C-terminal domain-containing protein [Phycisphaerales bacterium]
MPTPPPSLITAATLDRHADTRTAALAAAEAIGERLQGAADAILLFASFHHAAALPVAVETVRQVLHPSASIGVTASGVVGGGVALETGPGLAALGIRCQGARIRTFHFNHNDGPPEVWTTPLIRSRLRPMAPPKGILVFADPFTAGSDLLPERLAQGVPPGTPIAGGLLSGASRPGANVLVADHVVSNFGVAGLILEGGIEMETLVSHGCRPVGPPMVVTAADGPNLQSIGGTPAVKAIQEVSKQLSDKDRNLLANGPLIGIATDPSKPRFGRNDFLVRNVVAANERAGTLLLTGPIRTGVTIQVQVRDADTANEDLAMALDLAAMHPEPPAACILVTSTGRGEELFGEAGHDAAEFQRRLDAPSQTGFLATAEIAPVGGVPRVNGLGVVAALLREPS